MPFESSDGGRGACLPNVAPTPRPLRACESSAGKVLVASSFGTCSLGPSLRLPAADRSSRPHSRVGLTFLATRERSTPRIGETVSKGSVSARLESVMEMKGHRFIREPLGVPLSKVLHRRGTWYEASPVSLLPAVCDGGCDFRGSVQRPPGVPRPLNTFLKKMKPRVDNAITTLRMDQGICVNSLIPIWNHMLRRPWEAESIPSMLVGSWGRAARESAFRLHSRLPLPVPSILHIPPGSTAVP